MFFPGNPNILVLGDSVFMLFKCMYNNISTEKKPVFGLTCARSQKITSLMSTLQFDILIKISTAL